MKKITLSTLLSLVVIFSLVTTVFAETASLPGSGWYSGEQIQNVGASTATLNIVAYDSATANTYTISNETLAKGASKTYLPWNFPSLPANFQGSAVVSSSADVRAIVNVTNKYVASQGVGDNLSPSPAAAQYQGVVSPATTLYFPLAKNVSNTKSTSFAIQNAGSAATTVTATFKMKPTAGGSTTTYTYTTPSIGAAKMVVITPADALVPTGTIGSLTVVSNAAQNLAGTSLEYIYNEAHPTVLQSMRAFTSADFATTWYSPINKRAWVSRNTGLQVQNVSGASIANVTVTYIGSPDAPACAGITYTDSTTNLPDGESFTFLAASALPSNCLASAAVVASGNIVAIVSESYNPIPAGKYQEATSFNAFPISAATHFISLPLYKENSNGKNTGVSVMNVSGSTANIVIKFIGPTGTYVTNSISIPSQGIYVFLNVRNMAAGFWNGTAMTPAVLGCTATQTGCGANGIFGVIISSDQNVVAVANETTVGGWYLQDKNNYEGFNLTSDPTAP